MPIMLMTARTIDTMITLPPWSLAIEASREVMKDCPLRVIEGLDFLSRSKIEGNNKNEVRKVTHRPMAIIHPKSMTGRMPLNTNELKAKIVVKAA